MTETPQWSITGKTCLVTGATSGIGRAAAIELLQRGASVIAVARNEESARQLHETLPRPAPERFAKTLLCDLAETDQVRELANAVIAHDGSVDVLINAAGVSKSSHQVTKDGHEVTFAVNQLAPFVLTNILVPRLRQQKRARVLMLASDVHKMEKSIPWDDIEGEQKFSGRHAYGLSKLYNILFTRAMAERLSGTAVTINAYSPGFVRTSLSREATGAFRAFLTLTKPFQRSAEDAGSEVAQLVSDPELSDVTGQYFAKTVVKEPSPLARNRDAAERLWSVCAERSRLAVSL